MKQQKRIGLSPTTIEQEKINDIAKALDLTKTGVIKEIMHSRMTLDDLYMKVMAKNDKTVFSWNDDLSKLLPTPEVKLQKKVSQKVEIPPLKINDKIIKHKN